MKTSSSQLATVRSKRMPLYLLAAAFMLLSWVPRSSADEPVPQPSTTSTDEAPATEGLAVVDPSIRLRGSVWRTKAGIVFLKTPVGMLTLSSKTTLKDLKASYEVLFWVHEQNSVVEIRKRNDGSLVHRYFSGPMTFDGDHPKTLRWWTPDGDEITHYGTQEDKLGVFHEGDAVTVEVDESHTIIGVHDLQYDLQISQAPPSGAQATIVLSGTVAKLKSNFIFFRTPVGVVMVNAKIGVPQVKVGQPLTLQIDGSQVTVRLTAAATGSSRNNSGPLPSLAPAP